MFSAYKTTETLHDKCVELYNDNEKLKKELKLLKENIKELKDKNHIVPKNEETKL